MKGKRFTEEEIIGVLKDSEAGAATKELCRRRGCGPAALSWRRSGADGEPTP